MLRGSLPSLLDRGVMILGAEPANEVAGVNENWAGGLAHTINSACVNAVVLILLVQRPGEFEVAPILSSLNLAAKDNPFTRRKSDISRWTRSEERRVGKECK